MPFGDLRNNLGFGATFGEGFPHARSCCCTACADKSLDAGNGALDADGLGTSLLTGDSGDTQQGVNDTVPGSISTTFTIAVGGTQVGRVNVGGDDDWYRVELVAGQTYVFTLTGSGASPLQDPYLELRDSDGVLIAIDDDAGTGFSSLLRFTATDSGTYFINARAWEPDQGAPTLTGEYTLTMSTGAPQNPLDTIDFGYTFPDNTIAVYFSTQGETYSGDTAVRNWTQTEINAVMSALSTISAVTPLVFTQVTTAGQADFVLTLANLGSGVLGHFFIGTGHGAFNPNASSWTTAGLQPGGSGWVTVVHEILHGLGLAHPHDNGGIGDNDSEIMQGVTGPFSSYGTHAMNQGVFTMMSYNDGWQFAPWGVNSSLTTGSQSTPMALDIALLQQRYGVNPTTNNGNTTYVLNGSDSSYIAIWDTGGIDTISYSGATAATIDLRAATLLNEVGGAGWVSYVFGIDGGYTIANGVVIENAIGGAGNDTITGNSAANRFTGNGGADVLVGGSGIDTSVYALASTGATWARNPNGSWTVTAGVNGTDTLTTVEVLDFSDRDVVLDNAFRTFSGDGTSDLLWRRSDGLTATWSLQGASQTGAAVIGAVGLEWQIQATGDFSFDGADDILWRRSDGLLAIWGNGSSSQASIVAASSTAWDLVGVGDFNFDGRDDFLWRNPTTGEVAAWTMNGSAVSAQGLVGAAGADWSIQAIADFDGDGRDEILWLRDDGLLASWQLNGVVQTGSAIIGAVGVDWNVRGAGDFDGDGRADILWQRDDGLLAIWRMNGASLAASATIGFVGAPWSIENIGDYNGDGRDDIIWRNNADGTLALWTMNGFVVQNQQIVGVVPTEWGLI
jgi:hypothetical protein